MIGLVQDQFIRGERGVALPLTWSSWKLPRVARSSTTAKVQALTHTLEELDVCRFVFYELLEEDDKPWTPRLFTV